MGFFSSKPADTRPAILVVDDSALIVMSIKMILDPAGYEVIECSNGPDAVKFAEAKAPQLILLDMMMPGMDGIETLARLKSNAKTSPIPVLMVTGSQAGKDVEKAFGYGANGYVVKPVDAARLLAKIAATLSPKPAGPPA